MNKELRLHGHSILTVWANLEFWWPVFMSCPHTCTINDHESHSGTAPVHHSAGLLCTSSAHLGRVALVGAPPGWRVRAGWKFA